MKGEHNTEFRCLIRFYNVDLIINLTTIECILYVRLHK